MQSSQESEGVYMNDNDTVMFRCKPVPPETQTSNSTRVQTPTLARNHEVSQEPASTNATVIGEKRVSKPPHTTQRCWNLLFALLLFSSILGCALSMYLVIQVRAQCNRFEQEITSQVNNNTETMHSNLKGEKGECGAPGLNGEIGYPGAPGINGTKGQKGEMGTIGQPGSNGRTGTSGSPGPKGEKGQRGATGSSGPEGQKGECGSNIRLVGGGSRSGRVEIRHNCVWGTICDDSWDVNDGEVVCRMLGYGGVSGAPGSAKYGAGSGQIWLDDVACSGSENDLYACLKSAWGTHNCGHHEDASVECS